MRALLGLPLMAIALFFAWLRKPAPAVALRRLAYRIAGRSPPPLFKTTIRRRPQLSKAQRRRRRKRMH